MKRPGRSAWSMIGIVASVSLIVIVAAALASRGGSSPKPVGLRPAAAVPIQSTSTLPVSTDTPTPIVSDDGAPPIPTAATDITGNGMIFTPDPGGAKAAPTDASTIFQDYYHDAATVPSKDSEVYGSLTWKLPGGDVYRFKDLQVWGFGIFEECPPPRAAGANSAPEGDTCVDWQFLNAQNGDQVIDTGQDITNGFAPPSPIPTASVGSLDGAGKRGNR